MVVEVKSDRLGEEKVKELQEEANKLVDVHKFSAHAIQYNFGRYRDLSVSVTMKSKDQIILNCYPAIEH